MAPSPPVRPGTSDDLTRMVEALVLAFLDDPVMIWLFGEAERKVARGCTKLFLADGRRRSHASRSDV